MTEIEKADFEVYFRRRRKIGQRWSGLCALWTGLLSSK